MDANAVGWFESYVQDMDRATSFYGTGTGDRNRNGQTGTGTKQQRGKQ